MSVELAEILYALEQVAPRSLAFPGDKVGHQVGRRSTQVSKAVVALDRSLGAVQFGIEQGAQLLLTHHPLIYQPAETVTDQDHVGQTILLLIEHGMCHVAAHTNWDAAQGGINDVLADAFQLRDRRAFGMGATCDGETMPSGRVGSLPEALSLRDFGWLLGENLGGSPLVWGDPSKRVRTVAFTGGAADLDWKAALAAGADVFVTGEVRQHVALEASESGLAIAAAGHFATENLGTKRLRDRMAEAVSGVEWLFFSPEPGFSGRPL